MFPSHDHRAKFIVRSDCTPIRIEFVRQDGRWRTSSGPYTSSAKIAKTVFYVTSNETLHLMTEYIESIGRVIDGAMDSILVWKEDQRLLDEKRKAELESEQLARLRMTLDAESIIPRYVYLMKHSNGLVKIGFSKNPKAREKTLQAEDPRLKIVCYWEADISVEKRLHQIYDDLRVRGEWFKLKQHHVDWISRIGTAR